MHDWRLFITEDVLGYLIMTLFFWSAMRLLTVYKLQLCLFKAMLYSSSNQAYAQNEPSIVINGNHLSPTKMSYRHMAACQIVCDIFTLTETKIDDTFPSAQLSIKNMHYILKKKKLAREA